MPFEAGHPKKGGRKASTPNKITKNIREVLSSMVEAELTRLPEVLNTLKPGERASILVRLLPYVLTPAQDDTGQEMQKSGTIIKWGDKLIHV